jgi:hypothetical protein
MPYKKSDDPASMPLTSQVVTEPLRHIAEYYGYTAQRGPRAGQGDVVALAVAIGNGEIATVLLSNEQRYLAGTWLFEQAKSVSDPSLSEALASIARQLQAAAKREAETEFDDDESED